MQIGVPKEIKNEEFRVGLTPEAVGELVKNGHQVMVEANAGVGSGFLDQEYVNCGAIIGNAEEVWQNADMIIKVKEPLKTEFKYFREGLIIFAYLHLASAPELTQELLKKKVTSIAFETITASDGSLPCLKPMSQIAGRLAIQEGAKYLERHYGGRGILLSSVGGTEPGHVLILGAGNVGMNACKQALGLGADVVILNRTVQKLDEAKALCPERVKTFVYNHDTLVRLLPWADLVVGSVLAGPGASTPKLILREDLKRMKKGSLIVDVSIDQGGCCETSRPTSYDDPIYEVDKVLHYCVANMPGAVSRTSTQALTQAILPYAVEIARARLKRLPQTVAPSIPGLNTFEGKLFIGF